MAFTDLLTNILQPWLKIRVYAITVDSSVIFFPSGVHTAGFVLTDDGTGNATWQAPGGGGGGVTSISCPDAFSPKSIVFNAATGAVTASCSGNFGAATVQTTGSATVGTNLTVDGTTSTSALTVLDTATLGGNTIIDNTAGNLRITDSPVTNQVLTCQDDVLGEAVWQALPVQNILAQDASINVFPQPNGVFKVQASGQFGTNPVAGGTLSGTALTVTGAGSIDGQLTFANSAPVAAIPPAVLTCTNAFGAAQWAQLYNAVNNSFTTTLPLSKFLTPSPGVGVTPTLLIDQALPVGWYLVNASIYSEAETDGVQWATCFYLQTTAGAGDSFVGQQANEYKSPISGTTYEFSSTCNISCLVQIANSSDHLQLMGSTRDTRPSKVYVRDKDTASGGTAKVLTQLSSFLLFQ